MAASFDQSCTSDLDCVPVGQGSVCAQCAFECPSAAINKNALAAYKAAVARAGGSPMAICGCPNYGNPCCVRGQCIEACNDGVIDLDACAVAGGTCVPYASLLEGSPGCIRLAYCAPNPGAFTTVGVCCPTTAPMNDGGAGD